MGDQGINQAGPELLARFRPVLSKRRGLALGLWGEAGVGKTYTAMQLLQALPCPSVRLHATAPLAELSRRPWPALPRWAEVTLQRLQAQRQQPVSGSVEALAALLAATAPIVVALDDLHEAGAAQLEQLQALARLIQRSRGVALLVTSRHPPPEPFEAYPVHALDNDHSAMLLAGQLGVTLPSEAAAWVYQRAEGNPLFSLEYLRHLTRSGYLWNDGQTWHWRVPPDDLMPLTVEALIERLITDGSSLEHSRRALEARAMLPLDAPTALWAQVAGLSVRELSAAQTNLERFHLLRAGQFVHPLIREVRRKTLRPERKQGLAQRALEALKDDPIRAAPFVAQAGLEAVDSLHLLKRAAESAQERGDGVQAARLLAQAVNYAEGQERGRLALGAARGLRHADLLTATQLANLARINLPGSQEAVWLEAELFALQGRRAEMEQVLSQLPSAETGGAAWLERMILLKSHLGDHAAVVELWQGFPATHQGVTPEGWYQVASSLAHLGRDAQAQALAEEALAQPDLVPAQRWALSHLEAILRSHNGDYVGAVQTYGAVLSEAKDRAISRNTGACLYNRSIALRRLGRYDEARADLEEALHLYSEIGDGHRYAQTQVALGKHLALLGEYEEAERALSESLKVLERLDSQAFLIFCQGNLSLLYSEWPVPHNKVLALKYAHAALKQARRLNNPSSIVSGLYYAALAEATCGDAVRGLALADEGLALALALAQPGSICDVQVARATALAALGQQHEALQTFCEAQATAGRLGLTFEGQRIGLSIDKLTGDVGSAAQRINWLRTHGLLHEARKAQRQFPALAGEAASVTPERADLPLLTLFGPMQLAQGDDLKQVKGHKRRELLALLAEARLAGRAEVPLLNLLDALYPGQADAQAEAHLRQLVHQTREALGQSVITTTPNGYALGAVQSDAEVFLKTGDTQLWRGSYRAGLGEGEENVQEALHAALLSRAEQLLPEQPAEAVRLGKLLLEADPYHLDVLRLTLRAMRAGGNHRSLARLYGQGRERLLEVGERLPAAWTEFLGLDAQRQNLT